MGSSFNRLSYFIDIWRKRLPGLARGLGQGIREFKGAVDGVKDELKDVQESVDAPSEDEKS